MTNRHLFKEQFNKRCFLFSIALFKLQQTFYKERRFWALLDQLIRSGTSIGANVVEGGNSTSRKEFVNYFNIALKSAVETLYCLALLKEVQPQKTEEINQLITECQELKKLIATIILNTKQHYKL